MADPQTRQHSIIPWLFAIVVLAVVYVLSYAPVVKWKGPYAIHNPHNGPIVFAYPVDGTHLPMYRPVDCLIDETPLREPLLIWAGVWGACEAFEDARVNREIVDAL